MNDYDTRSWQPTQTPQKDQGIMKNPLLTIIAIVTLVLSGLVLAGTLLDRQAQTHPAAPQIAVEAPKLAGGVDVPEELGEGLVYEVGGDMDDILVCLDGLDPNLPKEAWIAEFEACGVDYETWVAENQ